MRVKTDGFFFAPDSVQKRASDCSAPESILLTDLPEKALGFRVQGYGMKKHRDLFNERQLLTLSTFSTLISKVKEKVESDGGSSDYAKAIEVFLAFSIDKQADVSSTLCSWININGVIRNTFARPTLSMVWDYAESNPFSSSSGSYTLILRKIVECISALPSQGEGLVKQLDVRKATGLQNVMISCDPPYYDNIGYADLSDFFYTWLRQSLKSSFPDLFKTLLVPKEGELIANPFRFDGSNEAARIFFENGMFDTFKIFYKAIDEDIPLTVYYAYKQSENGEDINCKGVNAVSSGWDTMLSAITSAGFCVCGTWPISTEKVGRTREISSNALASSIVLVCRKRPADAPVCTRRDFINALKRELKPALKKLQASNIAPVDLAQSAIGPGMSVYSRYSKVLEADGTPMSVRSALQLINQEIDAYFAEQEGDMDGDSRFCVDLFTQYAFNDVKYGEADVLARARVTSVDRLARRGILYAQKGVVRLLERDELPEKVDSEVLWLLTQQLTRALEQGGVKAAARIIAGIIDGREEHAKALAYRLYTISERKGWADEAYAYNSLVIAWPDIQAKVAELKSIGDNASQVSLFAFES